MEVFNIKNKNITKTNILKAALSEFLSHGFMKPV